MSLLDDIENWADHEVTETVAEVKAFAGYVGLSSAANATAANAKDTVSGAVNFVEQKANDLVQWQADVVGDLEDEALYSYSKTKASQTVDETIPKVKAVVDEGEKKLKSGGKLLDIITNPWALGAAAVIVGLAVLGPYVLPFFPRRGP